MRSGLGLIPGIQRRRRYYVINSPEVVTSITTEGILQKVCACFWLDDDATLVIKSLQKCKLVVEDVQRRGHEVDVNSRVNKPRKLVVQVAFSMTCRWELCRLRVVGQNGFKNECKINQSMFLFLLLKKIKSSQLLLSIGVSQGLL